MLKKIGFILLNLMFAFSHLACSHGGEGDPAGGTSLPVSKDEEIQAAVDLAQEFFISRNLFYTLRRYYKFDKKDPLEKAVFEILKKMDDRVFAKTDIFLSAVDCIGGPDHKAKDASVTKNDSDGKICISANRLKRFTPENLKQNMIIILAHEFAHISKFGEREADLISEFFTKKIATIMAISVNESLKQAAIEYVVSTMTDFHEFARKYNTKKLTMKDFWEHIGGLRKSFKTLNVFIPDPEQYPEMNLDREKHKTVDMTVLNMSMTLFGMPVSIGPDGRDTGEMWESELMEDRMRELYLRLLAVQEAVISYLGSDDRKMLPFESKKEKLFYIFDEANDQN